MEIFIGKALLLLLDVCFWIIILQVILSWLITFDVINIRNPQAANFVRLIDRVTSPVYTPLRKIIPPIAGIDITPIIVIFGIYLLQGLVASIFFY
ncbi:MAG: YggT family protein [Micavibrio sp.]